MAQKLLWLISVELPSVIQNEEPIPRCFARAVVIGIEDCQNRRILHVVSLEIMNIECDFNFVIARNQSETRDFTDKNLRADSLTPAALRFEDAVRGKDPLPEQAIESHACIEAR